MNTSGTLDIEDFEKYLISAFDIINGYILNINNCPVIPPGSYDDLRKSIYSDLPLQGENIGTLIDDIVENIVPYSTKIGHPCFLSWIITSPSPAGTLGELINVGLNQVPALYKGGKAATVLEDVVVRWFCQLFGYDNESGGILVSGGTMANLTALAAAREAIYPGATTTGIQNIEKPFVIYVSDQGHISVDRSAGMLGIGADMVRKIPTDEKYRMKPELLEEEILNDRSSGFEPFCVVAQAGAVNTGSIDPIDKLAEICERENIWFHVDASYGGGAVLSKNRKVLLKGIEMADSIATDPHKWFFIPAEAGLTIVKDSKHLYNAFNCSASYLGDEDSVDYKDYGFQLTRASRALKIWFAFRAYGLKRIGEIIDRNLELASGLYNRLENEECWELVSPSELSIVCFRYIPETKLDENSLNSLQFEILAELEQSGEAFLTPAVLRGKACLRICIANHRTTQEDIDQLIDLIRLIGETLIHDR